MDPSEKNHIEQNLSKLLEYTDCNTTFLAVLVELGILAKDDVDEIEAQQADAKKAKKLYAKLFCRTGSFSKLICALRETKQTGAASILESFSDVNAKFFHSNSQDNLLDVRFHTGTMAHVKLSEIEMARQHNITYNRRYSDSSTVNTSKYELEYDTCVKMYKTEMRKIIQRKKMSKDEDDLASYHKPMLNLLLSQFDSKMASNPENLVPATVSEYRKKLQQKTEEVYSSFHLKWEESKCSIVQQIDFFIFKFCAEVRNEVKQTLKSAVSLENINKAYENSVAKSLSQFRSKFSQLNEEFLNSCLDELKTSANRTFMEQTKQLEYVAGLAMEVETGQLTKEYRSEMLKAFSENPFIDGNDLQALHTTNREIALQKFDKIEKVSSRKEFVQKYKDQLLIQLDKSLETLKHEQMFKVERYVAEAKLFSMILVQGHIGKLKEKAYEMETGKELEEFHNKECEVLLLETFKTKCPLISKSPLYENLIGELAENLKDEYSKVLTEWNAKIVKTFHQVEKSYGEELVCQVSQVNGNSSAPPKVSSAIHEAASQAALSKFIPQKQAPAVTRLLSESKLLLDEKYNQQIVIGIDFGTEYCHAAVIINGKVEMIPHYDHSGQTFGAVASYVGVEEYDGYVGQCAQSLVRELLEPPVIYDIKDIVFNSKNLQWCWHRYNLPFSYKDGKDGPGITQGQFEYPVNIILSKLFTKIRQNAQEFLDRPVQNCIITLPLFFKQPERAYITEAAKMGGFRQVTVMEEVASVFVAVRHMNNLILDQEKKVMLIDIGMAWSNMYLLEVVGKDIKLLTYAWCDGGYIFQRNLASQCVDEFCRVENISMNDLNYDTVKRRRLTETCEKAVISLTSEETVKVVVGRFFNQKELNIEISRTKFEEVNAKHFLAITNKINEIVQAAYIENIILYGGYSKIPKVQETVRNCFNGRELMGFSAEADQILAYGAAVQSALNRATATN